MNYVISVLEEHQNDLLEKQERAEKQIKFYQNKLEKAQNRNLDLLTKIATIENKLNYIKNTPQ